MSSVRHLPGAKLVLRFFEILTVIFIIALPVSAQAHLELYHNVEVNFTETKETGNIRLYFTIHAPELLVGFENAGSDIFDADWLRKRSDDEFNTLFKRGRIFVKEKFGFHFDSNPELDLSTHLQFEPPETLSDINYQSGVPVGCILASAELKLNPKLKTLTVTLKKDAGKRLLLVCTRKGAFPETKDMDTGDVASFLLPERKILEPSISNVGKKHPVTFYRMVLPGVMILAVLLLTAWLWCFKSKPQ